MTALETDEQLKVVVFDSAVEGFFLNHSDFLAKLEDLTGIPRGPTGLGLAGYPGTPDSRLLCFDRPDTRTGDRQRQ